MVKLTGPGLGHGARGALGDSVIFSTSKGRAYLKTHRKPKQPRTPDQIAMRAIMAFISSQWSAITAGDQATWDAPALPDNLSHINAYQRQNLTRWRNRQAPGNRYPILEDDDPGTGETLLATGGPQNVTLTVELTTAVNQNWAILLWHSTVATPDPDWNKLVHLFPYTAFGAQTWIHRNLTPGTHYYRTIQTSKHGTLKPWRTATDSAVVT
jgi:hypothetical protein